MIYVDTVGLLPIRILKEIIYDEMSHLPKKKRKKQMLKERQKDSKVPFHFSLSDLT